ncbi:MAG: hypothetical protein AAF787_23550 [Chloroflexota bacterium]
MSRTFNILTGVAVILVLASCRTNTRLDTVFYDTEYTQHPIEDDLRAGICLNVEAQGYQFDIFDAYHSVEQVTYPDGTQIEFVSDNVTIQVREITGIDRQFGKEVQISDEELKRLATEANETCAIIESLAGDILETEVNAYVSSYDYIAGTVILYQGECGEFYAPSPSFGSYAIPEQFEESICTSDLYALSSGN